MVVMRDVAGLIMDGFTILARHRPCVGMDEARSEQSEIVRLRQKCGRLSRAWSSLPGPKSFLTTRCSDRGAKKASAGVSPSRLFAHHDMLALLLQATAWSPVGVSRHHHRHRHQRVVATEVSVLAQLDDLYRMLLIDGPIEIEYAPEQVADQLVGLATNRPVVGVHVTPAGWFGLSLASLWTLYSPAGLVAYLRDARARGEELPMHLEWVPEHVWPQRQPEEAGGVQAESAAQATQTDDQAIR